MDFASAGETVVIAKAGRPVAKLVRFDAPSTRPRLGFPPGHARVPDDLDAMNADAIAELFENES